MKKIFLGLLLLSLTSCEGSTAEGFWGPSMEHPLCTYYGNCGGGGESTPAPSKADSSDTKGCELYGNCE